MSQVTQTADYGNTGLYSEHSEAKAGGLPVVYRKPRYKLGFCLKETKWVREVKLLSLEGQNAFKIL